MPFYKVKMIRIGEEDSNIWFEQTIHADSQKHAEELCQKFTYRLIDPLEMVLHKSQECR